MTRRTRHCAFQFARGMSFYRCNCFILPCVTIFKTWFIHYTSSIFSIVHFMMYYAYIHYVPGAIYYTNFNWVVAIMLTHFRLFMLKVSFKNQDENQNILNIKPVHHSCCNIMSMWFSNSQNPHPDFVAATVVLLVRFKFYVGFSWSKV
jgi:hypothetical protein